MDTLYPHSRMVRPRQCTPSFYPILFVGLWVLLMPLSLTAETFTASSQSIARVVWNKRPIPVLLIVGQERLVHFSASVSVGVPDDLAPILRSQSIHGTLYLTAHQPFENRRIIVRSEREGPLYVLDVRAMRPPKAQENLPDLQVLLQSEANQAPQKNLSSKSAPAISYVTLTRFAAQQLYAPRRLLSTMPGVVRVPVVQKPVSLIRGEQVTATPLAAWRAGLLTVTALKLVNTGTKAVVLDPRALRGRWLTATFQHNRLHASGSEADTTSLYLISTDAFALSLYGAM